MPRWTILHDADGLVVVDKPPGLETTGRTRDDPGGLECHLARALGRRVWAVHQIDRDTSGLVLFVRRKALVAEWQTRLRGATKRYLAIAHGRMASQTVEGALAYDDATRRWVVREGGKPARTDLEVLAATDVASRIEARPATGRTHQIRVHLAHVGHPLYGEPRYADPPCREHPRHALHLGSLSIDGRVFEAPVPDDLVQLAARLGIGD
ncbi:MAG: RNA pseudouridine synthase [Myxococcales bacterium]|nr:RNA pseudouridine synthase [Myxococcales bacterium]